MRKYALRYLKINDVEIPVIFLIDPNVEFVYMCGNSRYARSYERLVESAHFLEHYTMRATKSFPDEKAVGDTIFSLGGWINGQTGDNVTRYIGIVPKEKYKLLAQVITEILWHPLLVPEDLDKEKHAIEVELSKRRNDFRYKASVLFAQAFYKEGAAGYRTFVDDRLASLATITHEQISEVHKKNYAADNIVLGFGGCVDPDEVMDLLKELASDIPLRATPDVRSVEPPEYKHLVLEEDVHAEMVMLGFTAPTESDPDYPAFLIIRNILAGKPTARLRYRMRDIENLSYNTSLGSITVGDQARFSIFSDAKKGQADRAEQCIIEELLRLRDGATERELANAKQAIIGHLKTREMLSDLVNDVVSHFIASGELKSAEALEKALSTVSLEDVKRVAQKYIPKEFTKENYASAKIIAKR